MSKPKPFQRRIAIVLLAIFIPSLFPVNMLYASNNGPSAPEAQGFEPVTATDMVNLTTGDMSYMLPVMDVNGFPITMSYHGGIPLDLESSWVGLGWNLNTGAINRNLNATPDDWKGGNSLDFIRYEDSETTFSVNVGVGITALAEVGVGMSMSSNKGMSGSVYGSFAMTSASIDTNGNYSLGLQVGISKGGASFGGGITMSGNVNSGEKDFSVGAGVKTSSGLTIGMGTSLTNGGISASLGYGNTKGEGLKTTGGSGAAGISMNSFSQGDWDISSKGWYIPAQIGPITFGFGKRKTKFTLAKGYKKRGYGVLYSNQMNNQPTSTLPVPNDSKIPDYIYSDYQNRFIYGDAYDQALPQPEKEFVGDYDAEREKINFTYAGYDSYDVNATGISGSMTPKVFENATLYGMGYIGSNPNSTDGKQRIYYHDGNISRKTFGTSTNNFSKDLRFYFEGQFTSNKTISPLTPIISGSNPGGLALYNTLSNKPPTNNEEKLQQGNFVEVFTNSQINNNLANGLLVPKDLPNSQRTVANKFMQDGIGGYKVTAPDGKIYHFSLPVYNFEEVHRTILKDDSENHVNEKRQYTPYATHWLLTAITGPDYFDINGNNIADESDYGYWVRLDHGKWSDGYVWRTPTDPTLKDYASNIESNIGDKEFGMYEFGRKQLYYLDKIVSNTHTAYFVKDLRYDSVGCDLHYWFKPNSNILYPNAPSLPIENQGLNLGNINVAEDFTYKRQLQLMLKKIVLVNNSDAQVFEQTINQGSNPLQLNVGGLSDYVDNYNPSFSPNGEFVNEFGSNYNIKLNQEQKVIDIKDFENFDNSKAIKVIDFQYNYNLAVKDHNYNTNPDNLSNGSPGVIKNTAMNPNHGKLTLKSVRFLGRNNFDYMPPYQFEYDGEFKGSTQPYVAYPPNSIAQRFGLTGWKKNYQNTTPQFGVIGTPMQNIRAKDEWGFRKDRPEAWTMTKISTPTGASINFEHEEDDYYTEAFSRRYWMDNLQFNVTPYGNGSTVIVEIKNEQGLSPWLNVDFTKYFGINDKAFLDLWICRVENSHYHSPDHGWIDVNSSLPNPVVTYVDSQTLHLQVSAAGIGGDHANLILNHNFSKNYGTNVFQGTNRDCPDPPDGGDHHKMTYKLLGTKVPQDETGGGLRVKSITLKDENNNQYKTGYSYNMPGTNKTKNVGDYKSSGITSYSPVKGTKFIPYQSELPSAGVMYEYVTMTSENSSGQNLGKTQYRFYTLRPVLDIFNPNIEMKYDDGEMMFKAELVDYNNNNGYFDPTSNRKVQAKSINVKVNTSLVGQFRSIEEFNTEGQLMTKSEKKYMSGTTLKGYADLLATNKEKVYRGTIKESFQSMKSIYTTDSDDNNPVLSKRMLSVSSKEEYPSVLTELTTLTSHGKSTEYYKGSDPMTGTFNIVEKRNSEGKLTRIERIPAYSVKTPNGTLAYSSMGSKVNSIANKNMLTQEAMVITSTGSGSNWKAIDANITTWNDTWKYRNEDSGTDVTETFNKVWRKHKTFAWKEGLSYDGTYLTNIKSDYTEFDFGIGAPASNNSKWQKLSEVTRYTRWSSPIETKDINGNFASTKMADNGTKVLVSGNARYTEMYYSGAEFVKSGNLFDGEVKGANFRSADVAHTGNYSVKAVNAGDHLFEVNGSSGNTDYYNNQDNYTATFRPGKYKASVWVLIGNYAIKPSIPDPNAGPANFSVNGNLIPVSDIVTAGCWKQLNYYFDIPVNRATNSIVLSANFSYGSNYFDDFRMCPISSSLNSYVYDQDTDELSYMLDANNMGAAFKYDDAGRLRASYAEVVDTQVLTGGFKITSQYKQNYKNSNTIVNNALPTIDNCLNNYYPLSLEINNEGIGSFENKFIAKAKGGSDSFSYEYKWKNNFESKTYSNYISGTSELFIPYVPKYCSSDKFSKFWSFVVKVTDLNSGEFIEKEYEYGTECEFSIKDGQWADIEINNVSDFCFPEKRRFKIYLKDIRMEGNFKYEYAYYNPEVPFNNQSLNWINVSNDKGGFCPTFSIIEDINCSTGYRKAAFFTYKITNLTNGEITLSYPQVYFAECVENNNNTFVNPSSEDLEYAKEGILISKDLNGKVTNIRDTNKETK